MEEAWWTPQLHLQSWRLPLDAPCVHELMLAGPRCNGSDGGTPQTLRSWSRAGASRQGEAPVAVVAFVCR
jgi:hypothetical protein